MADFRFLAPLAVLVGVLLFVPAASASHVRCGDTITQDTVLDSDLVCPGNGLSVRGEVELDLAGHAITGSGDGLGLECFCDKFDVRGGTIRGFGQAIFQDGARLTVDDMLVEDNGRGLECHFGDACFVEDSTFRRNLREGVRLFAPDNNPIGAVRRNRIYENGRGLAMTGYDGPVTGNLITRNDDYGIWLDYGGGATVTGNVIVENGGDGVMVTFDTSATVAHNVIERNGGNGVSADYQVGIKVHDNRISRNGADGIYTGRYVTALLERNRADRNGDDGIDVDPCSEINCEFYKDVTVRANRAFFNADLGIEAPSYTTDGGGNRAKHNGNPAQCVEVRCR